MAFNFNWSPLIADTHRAKELLTNALNKSPKPPIIVDDIIVSELNLGSAPPDLEILEIGDLAEDRFRGIFKMSYAGDAFLTLRTRVQANPLNTWGMGKPDWTQPGCLAANGGLTIPLAITLSDIRLSGFVILVFSKNKGMTLVFRNDPLESLKVSSTFDSIPFVRDYLQREIEKQLRNLFMEDLPAILHRLSLRLWSPEYRELDDRLIEKEKAELSNPPVDPLASPPQDGVDYLSSAVPQFSLDSAEYHASFSQKNLLRLAALNDSHRTLSLFTPPVRDAVFRAWAGANEQGTGAQTPHTHTIRSSLSRINSQVGSAASTSDVLSDGATEATSRTTTSYTFNGTTSRYTGRPRKAKKRVINLRRTQTTHPDSSIPDNATESSTPEPSVAPSSAPSVVYEGRAEEELQTPPRTPLLTKGRRHRASSLDETPRASMLLNDYDVPVKRKEKQKARQTQEEQPPAYTPPDDPLASLHQIVQQETGEKPKKPRARPISLHSDFSRSSSSSELLRTLSSEKLAFGTEKGGVAYGSLGAPFSPGASSESSGGGILEQAWLNKIARDIARKVGEERRRSSLFDGSVEAEDHAEEGASRSEKGRLRGGGGMFMDAPPPAYAA